MTIKNPETLNLEEFSTQGQSKDPCLPCGKAVDKDNVFKSLSLTDKLLPVLIILSITLGLLIGNLVPDVKLNLEASQIDSVSLPVMIGLIVMMVPVLTKVNYSSLPLLFKSIALWKLLLLSFLLNWIVGPFLMAVLAWLTLYDLSAYRTGIIMVGIARCIAMVMIWNGLAGGNNEFCAVLVAFNSFLQIFLYGPLAILILRVIPEAIGLEAINLINLSLWQISKSVFIFLGIPFILGVVIRYLVIFLKGRTWLDSKFLPKFALISLLGLLYTIVVLFAIQGKEVVEHPVDVVRTAVPLLLYFIIMFFMTFLIAFLLKTPYAEAVTQSFTAASNNFELAIAVVVGSFGTSSPEALGAIVGPLIEVPVLVILVYITLYFKKPYVDRLG